jgi:hypothetical protein
VPRAAIGRCVGAAGDSNSYQLSVFPVWTDPQAQRRAANRLRDRYLLFRPPVRFDAERKIFTLAPSQTAEGTEHR